MKGHFEGLPQISTAPIPVVLSFDAPTQMKPSFISKLCKFCVKSTIVYCLQYPVAVIIFFFIHTLAVIFSWQLSHTLRPLFYWRSVSVIHQVCFWVFCDIILSAFIHLQHKEMVIWDAIIVNTHNQNWQRKVNLKVHVGSPDSLPGPKTASSTASATRCHNIAIFWVSLSEFCHLNPLCSFSKHVYSAS